MLRTLYLTALGRPPEPSEGQELLGALAARPDRHEAWKDLVWAILCSREFAENH